MPNFQITMSFKAEMLKPGDEIWLARMLAGEVNTMGNRIHEASVMCVNVAMNRARKSWWVNSKSSRSPIQQVVQRDFHGTIKGKPPTWAVNMVAHALTMRARGDYSGGALFLLGGIDIRPEIDWVSHVNTVAWKDQAVHIFTDWPYR